MLRLAFDFIITWRETRTRPNAYNFLPINPRRRGLPSLCFTLQRYSLFYVLQHILYKNE